MTVLGVVLAAGRGERFAAGPKQFAVIDGDPLVVIALRAAMASSVDSVVVVQGAVELGALVPGGVVVLDNPRWAEGIATSLQVAIAHARAHGHDAAVIGLADQPGVTTAAWSALATAPDEPPVAVADYGGHRGNPVRLAASVWGLLPTTGDEGARVLMRGRPDLVQAVPCDGDPRDVDRVDDLDLWP